MELRLEFLDSFAAKGSDGRSYKVRAYDRLTHDLGMPAGSDHWASTGESEYRLDDGRAVEVGHGGQLRISGTEVLLELERQVQLG